MDWNRPSPFVETPLRACLAIVAVNATLILVSEPIFQALEVVSSEWPADQQLASAFFLFLLFVGLSVWVWYRFGRLMRGRFTILQRLSAAAIGVLPIAAAAWLAEARAEGVMCGILGAYVTGVGASGTAFLTVMIASGIDPRFDLDSGGLRPAPEARRGRPGTA